MRIAEGKQELRGLRVSITGRLASMSRDEACARIAAAGGQYDATPSADTALLVVGQGGPPLGEDGRLTRSLRAARGLEGLAAKHGGALRGYGRAVEFVLMSRRVAELRAEDGGVVLTTGGFILNDEMLEQHQPRARQCKVRVAADGDDGSGERQHGG